MKSNRFSNVSNPLRMAVAALLATVPSLTAHDFGEGFELSAFGVESKGDPLIGKTITSSQGVVSQVDLEYRPILRTGEVLESVPGLIATQHSGTGKANQYFLRGFNLDHATDFSARLNGMPINLPTHGHGQGYLDLNFVIPETIQQLEFRKGSYFADVGDFSSAGSTEIQTYTMFPQDFVKVEWGEDRFRRMVVGQSLDVGPGHLTYALEGQTYDGPWEIGEDLEKLNALVTYSQRFRDWQVGITVMGYDANWNAADQIPQRTVESRMIGEFGSIDEDLGGETSRYSFSANATRRDDRSVTELTAYAIRYELNLWSNFTYFLDDPVNGDEFEQLDKRMIYGGEIIHSLRQEIGERRIVHRFGLQARFDDIEDIGLFKTVARQRLSTVRRDSVDEWSVGVFHDNTIHWTEKLRSIAGIRWDAYGFEVNSNVQENSGRESADIFSPKLSVVYAASEQLEVFVSAGLGFHSNDARGTTITVDPTDPATPADAVDPLVRSQALESGLRFSADDRFNSSLTVWWLELDSELLFVGDAGITEPSRPSERYGIEWSNYFRATRWLTLDAELSVSEALFSDSDPAGRAIPGAIDTVVQAGATWHGPEGLFATLRMRHFGGRPLVEDSSVKSAASTAFNLRFGWSPSKNWRLTFDVLNILDSGDHDITYFYESRLPGEPVAGVADIHYHVMEPRTLRTGVEYRF